jgi:hypothetical protein
VGFYGAVYTFFAAVIPTPFVITGFFYTDDFIFKKNLLDHLGEKSALARAGASQWSSDERGRETFRAYGSCPIIR